MNERLLCRSGLTAVELTVLAHLLAVLRHWYVHTNWHTVLLYTMWLYFDESHRTIVTECGLCPVFGHVMFELIAFLNCYVVVWSMRIFLTPKYLSEGGVNDPILIFTAGSNNWFLNWLSMPWHRWLGDRKGVWCEKSWTRSSSEDISHDLAKPLVISVRMAD